MSVKVFYDERHQEYAERVREFAETEVAPRVKDMMADHESPEDLFKRGGELGLYYAAVPEKAGGLGLGMTGACILMEELAKVSPGFALCVELTGNGLSDTGHNLLNADDAAIEAWKQSNAAGLNGDAMNSASFSHPEGQSNPAEWNVDAVLDGDEIVLNGEADYVTNVRAPHTSYLVKMEDGQPHCIVVPAGTEGWTHDTVDIKLGQAGNGGGVSSFKDARVPASCDLGVLVPGGVAYYNVYTTFCAEALGAAEGILNKTIQHCKTTKVNGEPMVESQVVAHRLCYLQARVYAMQTIVYDLARRVDADVENPSDDYYQEYGWRSQAAKVVCGELSSEIARECMELLGESAYSDPEIWHFYGDIEDYSIMDLSSDIIWDLMVRDFGLRDYSGDDAAEK